jgi:hypothetical protein
MRRVLAVLLCSVLLLAVSGCEVEKEKREPTKEKAVKEKPVKDLKELAKTVEGKLISFEGEDFPNGGYERYDSCGWKYGNNTPGYSGKGHLVSGGAGCPTKMSFEVRKGGAYTVWIRHCCQEGGEGRLHIDSWQHDFGKEEEVSGTFKWAKLGECKLEKGEHTILIEDLGPGWTVIDRIILALDKEFDPRKAT